MPLMPPTASAMKVRPSSAANTRACLGNRQNATSLRSRRCRHDGAVAIPKAGHAHEVTRLKIVRDGDNRKIHLTQFFMRIGIWKYELGVKTHIAVRLLDCPAIIADTFTACQDQR